MGRAAPGANTPQDFQGVIIVELVIPGVPSQSPNYRTGRTGRLAEEHGKASENSLKVVDFELYVEYDNSACLSRDEMFPRRRDFVPFFIPLFLL